MANACVLCGDDSARLTDEHVLSEWFSKSVYPDAPESTYWFRASPDSPTLHQWTGKSFDLKVKVLCANCNTGWLSPIEGRVKDILAPMILGTGRPRWIRPPTQRLLAFWAVKTAMMADYLPPSPTLIPDAEKKEFRRRENPLPSHRVWIATRPHPLGTDESPVATLHRQPVSTFMLTEEQKQTLPVQQWSDEGRIAYRVTFAVGCVMFQVFGCDFPTTPRVIVPPDNPVEQIWPVQRRFKWPTPPGFDRDEGPSQLHKKFDPPPGGGPFRVDPSWGV